MRPWKLIAGLLTLLATACPDYGQARDPETALAPAVPSNPITELQARLDRGVEALSYDEKFGYLRPLLESLKIPVESQTLVFSQTSLQRNRISPRTPRAIYFNDDTYVGFCQAGDLIEISTADPGLGAVYYTLDQAPSDKPQFHRETDRCLQCHESTRTEGIPGHLVRSLFVSQSGQPIFSGGSYSVDHTTPFEHRWGGWYVTGVHGAQKHLGNLIIEGKDVPTKLDNDKCQNLTSLPERVRADGYLTPHSDIIALMVLEHQTFVHNRIAKAADSARQALQSDSEMRQILGESEGALRESTVRRIHNAGDKLVEGLLFVKEAPLTAPVAGTSGYAEAFVRDVPRDEQGRSLRDFDLQTRLFKHPCSYLIGSQAFKLLPDELRNYVWERLWAVLVDGADAKKFAHLSAEDRRAIVEIIRSTQPHAPEFWRTRPLAVAAN